MEHGYRHALWYGILCVKNDYACKAQLSSNIPITEPQKLRWQVYNVLSHQSLRCLYTVKTRRGKCLNLKWQMKTTSTTIKRYLKMIPAAGMMQNGEVFSKAWYFNVSSLNPLDSKERFSTIKNHLYTTDSIAVVKTGEDILLILADTKLAESLGLKRMDRGLHCIILSKKSKLIRGRSPSPEPDTQKYLGCQVTEKQPASNYLTLDKLKEAFKLYKEQSGITCSSLEKDGMNTNKEDKRVLPSGVEHPDRKRHKSEHSPRTSLFADSKEYSVAILTAKRDQLLSIRKRHKSETFRKPGGKTSKQNRDVDSVPLPDDERRHPCEDKMSEPKSEKITNKSLVSSRDKLKIHGAKKTDCVTNFHNVSSPSREHPTVYKKKTTKVSKMSILEKKQLESQKVLSRLNLQNKENVKLLGRIPRKKPTEAETSLSKHEFHSRQQFIDENQDPKPTKKVPDVKKEGILHTAGQADRTVTWDTKDAKNKHDRKLNYLVDCVQDQSLNDPELFLERDSRLDLFMLESDNKTSDLSDVMDEHYRICRKNPLQSVMNYPFTWDQTPKFEIPGFGDLDKLRDIENKVKKIKIVRKTEKTEDGLLVIIKEVDSCYEMRCATMTLTDFITESLHCLPKNEVNARSKPCYLCLAVASSIHNSKQLLQLERIVTLDELDPFNIKVIAKCSHGFENESCDILQSSSRSKHEIEQKLKAQELHIESSLSMKKSENGAVNSNTRDTVHRASLIHNIDVSKSENMHRKVEILRQTDEIRPTEVCASAKLDHSVQESASTASKCRDKEQIEDKKDMGTEFCIDLKRHENDAKTTCKTDVTRDSEAENRKENEVSKKILNKEDDSQALKSIKVVKKTEAVNQPLKRTVSGSVKVIDQEEKSIGPAKNLLGVPKTVVQVDSEKNAIPKILSMNMKEDGQPPVKKMKTVSKPSMVKTIDELKNKETKDKKRSERRHSGDKSQSKSSTSSLTNKQTNSKSETLIDKDKVSTGCEMSSKRSHSTKDSTLRQRLEKIADLSVPNDGKIKKTEKRQARQFHPYKKDVKTKSRKGPSWSFDIAYSDMDELLQNLTENMFKLNEQQRTDVGKWRKGTSRSRNGRFRGRFYGMRFCRSEVPIILPSSSDTRESDGEFELDQDQITTMEERSRQADMVEETWQTKSEEETVFIEEMCAYNKEREQGCLINKSSDTKMKDSPDTTLIIPGGGKTFTYSAIDIGDGNESSEDRFEDGSRLDDVKHSSLGVDENITRKVYICPNDIFESVNANSKSEDEILKKTGSKKKEDDCFKKTELHSEDIPGQNSGDATTSKEVAEECCDNSKDVCTEQIKEVAHECCDSNNDVCTEQINSQIVRKQSRLTEPKILSSDSDICLDWTDDDLLSERSVGKSDSEDDDDDKTFVVIDTVEDCDSDASNCKDYKIKLLTDQDDVDEKGDAHCEFAVSVDTNSENMNAVSAETSFSNECDPELYNTVDEEGFDNTITGNGDNLRCDTITEDGNKLRMDTITEDEDNLKCDTITGDGNTMRINAIPGNVSSTQLKLDPEHSLEISHIGSESNNLPVPFDNSLVNNKELHENLVHEDANDESSRSKHVGVVAIGEALHFKEGNEAPKEGGECNTNNFQSNSPSSPHTSYASLEKHYTSTCLDDDSVEERKSYLHPTVDHKYLDFLYKADTKSEESPEKLQTSVLPVHNLPKCLNTSEEESTTSCQKNYLPEISTTRTEESTANLQNNYPPEISTTQADERITILQSNYLPEKSNIQIEKNTTNLQNICLPEVSKTQTEVSTANLQNNCLPEESKTLIQESTSNLQSDYLPEISNAPTGDGTTNLQSNYLPKTFNSRTEESTENLQNNYPPKISTTQAKERIVNLQNICLPIISTAQTEESIANLQNSSPPEISTTQADERITILQSNYFSEKSNIQIEKSTANSHNIYLPEISKTETEVSTANLQNNCFPEESKTLTQESTPNLQSDYLPEISNTPTEEGTANLQSNSLPETFNSRTEEGTENLQSNYHPEISATQKEERTTNLQNRNLPEISNTETEESTANLQNNYISKISNSQPEESPANLPNCCLPKLLNAQPEDPSSNFQSKCLHESFNTQTEESIKLQNTSRVLNQQSTELSTFVSQERGPLDVDSPVTFNTTALWEENEKDIIDDPTIKTSEDNLTETTKTPIDPMTIEIAKYYLSIKMLEFSDSLSETGSNSDGESKNLSNSSSINNKPCTKISSELHSSQDPRHINISENGNGKMNEDLYPPLIDPEQPQIILPKYCETQASAVHIMSHQKDHTENHFIYERETESEFLNEKEDCKDAFEAVMENNGNATVDEIENKYIGQIEAKNTYIDEIKTENKYAFEEETNLKQDGVEKIEKIYTCEKKTENKCSSVDKQDNKNGDDELKKINTSDTTAEILNTNGEINKFNTCDMTAINKIGNDEINKFSTSEVTAEIFNTKDNEINKFNTCDMTAENKNGNDEINKFKTSEVIADIPNTATKTNIESEIIHQETDDRQTNIKESTSLSSECNTSDMGDVDINMIENNSKKVCHASVEHAHTDFESGLTQPKSLIAGNPSNGLEMTADSSLNVSSSTITLKSIPLVSDSKDKDFQRSVSTCRNKRIKKRKSRVEAKVSVFDVTQSTCKITASPTFYRDAGSISSPSVTTSVSKTDACTTFSTSVSDSITGTTTTHNMSTDTVTGAQTSPYNMSTDTVTGAQTSPYNMTSAEYQSYCQSFYQPFSPYSHYGYLYQGSQDTVNYNWPGTQPYYTSMFSPPQYGNYTSMFSPPQHGNYPQPHLNFNFPFQVQWPNPFQTMSPFSPDQSRNGSSPQSASPQWNFPNRFWGPY